MDKARSSTLQKRLRNEAMAMLGLAGCEASVTEYQQAIRLVGKACGIPHTDTEEHLKLIDAAKDEMQRKTAGEVISGTVIPDDIIPNWMPVDVHETVMALFEVSVQLEQHEERCALYSMANVLLETQSFEDWLVNIAGGGTPGQEPLT